MASLPNLRGQLNSLKGHLWERPIQPWPIQAWPIQPSKGQKCKKAPSAFQFLTTMATTNWQSLSIRCIFDWFWREMTKFLVWNKDILNTKLSLYFAPFFKRLMKTSFKIKIYLWRTCLNWNNALWSRFPVFVQQLFFSRFLADFDAQYG